MSIKMEEILKNLEDGSNPEESFNAALQEKKAEYENSDAEGQETKTPETSEDSDMDKIAEADSQGRIMARAFYDELEKIGVAPVAEYPADPGAVPNNPAVEVGRGEPAQRNQEAQAAANALISQLTAAGKVGAGEVATPAGAQPVAHSDPQEGNRPLAADVAKAKERAATGAQEEEKTSASEGANRIVSELYDKLFNEEGA